MPAAQPLHADQPDQPPFTMTGKGYKSRAKVNDGQTSSFYFNFCVIRHIHELYRLNHIICEKEITELVLKMKALL